jgi:outer membrane protein assembly factor BamA
MRITRFAISSGQVSSVPYIADLHPGVTGLDTGLYWAHKLALTFDTRDSIDIPTRGAFATLYTELADRALGSSTSFVKFGGEWKDFIPLWRNNPTLALHALTDYTSGSSDTPFWEQASLGGRRTLRGFGSDRFIDFNRSLATAEVRTKVYDRHMFGVNLEIELAPFVEAGQVFRHVAESPVNDLHWVGGLGFRGVVRPQIVGFVDLGHGSEGTSIFTGIDYPF